MTIVSNGSAGSRAEVTTTKNFVLTKSLVEGEILIIAVAADNDGGLGNEHETITLSAGRGYLTKIGEAFKPGGTFPSSNVNLSLWRFVPSRPIPSGTVFTVTMPDVDDIIITAWSFSVAADHSLRIADFHLENDDTLIPPDFPAQNLSGLDSATYLWFGAHSRESNDFPTSQTALFTKAHELKTTSISSAITLLTEFQISSGTSKTFQPDWSQISSYSSIVVALEEYFNLQPSAIAEILVESPVSETWEWKTDVIQSINSATEQRIALRISPRMTTDYTMLTLNEDDRRKNLGRLHKEIGTSKNVPMFQYGSYVTQTVNVGATRIYFDAELSDVRIGDYLYLYTQNLRYFEIYEIEDIHTDGVTLATGVNTGFLMNSFAVPSRNCQILDGSGLSTMYVTGDMKILAQCIETRDDFVNPLFSVSLTTYQSLPVLGQQPTSDGTTNELLSMENSLVDNEIGVFSFINNRTSPYLSTSLTFYVDRITSPGSMNYWREFFHEVKGRRGAFWFPTNREDFIINTDIDVVQDYIICDDNRWEEYYEGREEFSYIQFKAQDGEVIYRKIICAYSSELGTEFQLDSAFPDEDRWKTKDLKVSFLMKCRLEEDSVKFEHHQRFSKFQISLRTVEE
jgi:hypothetical protein